MRRADQNCAVAHNSFETIHPLVRSHFAAIFPGRWRLSDSTKSSVFRAQCLLEIPFILAIDGVQILQGEAGQFRSTSRDRCSKTYKTVPCTGAYLLSMTEAVHMILDCSRGDLTVSPLVQSRESTDRGNVDRTSSALMGSRASTSPLLTLALLQCHLWKRIQARWTCLRLLFLSLEGKKQEASQGRSLGRVESASQAAS